MLLNWGSIVGVVGEFRFSNPGFPMTFSFPLVGAAALRNGLGLREFEELDDNREPPNQPRLIGAGVAEPEVG